MLYRSVAQVLSSTLYKCQFKLCVKPRTDEQFFLDRVLVKFIFSCARQTMFLINISVTSFITSLHVADTSKYFMYIYYIGLKAEDESNFNICIASSNQSISFSIFHDRPYTRTVFLAPCQGKLVNFLPYIRAIKTCQNKFVKEKLPVVCAALYIL